MMLERVDVHTQQAKIRPMHLKPQYTTWEILGHSLYDGEKRKIGGRLYLVGEQGGQYRRGRKDK